MSMGPNNRLMESHIAGKYIDKLKFLFRGYNWLQDQISSRGPNKKIT